MTTTTQFHGTPAMERPSTSMTQAHRQAAADPETAPSLWHIALAWLLRTFYFRHIRVVGAKVQQKPHQLILCSHRNGAIDGYLALAAFPRAKFLLSAQLLRFWLLRLMFTGIPVVRDKDRERYDMARQSHGNPILAARDYLRQGGILCTFPEGSSEWGPRPLPCQPGTARIVRMLLAEGIPLEVIPMGLFYQAPDRFRSDVDILIGKPVELPAQGSDDRHAWEAKIDAALTAALHAVSPDCPDMPTFERVERLAVADAANGESYAVAFKRRETGVALPPVPAVALPRRRNWRDALALPFVAVFAVVLGPILLAAWLAGKKADGRNTITFFRLLGGVGATLFWLPVLIVIGFFYLRWMLLAAALAWIGWRRLK